jgi:hypothetical protein
MNSIQALRSAMNYFVLLAIFVTTISAAAAESALSTS